LRLRLVLTSHLSRFPSLISLTLFSLARGRLLSGGCVVLCAKVAVDNVASAAPTAIKTGLNLTTKFLDCFTQAHAKPHSRHRGVDSSSIAFSQVQLAMRPDDSSARRERS
jgi:hypothetical protein